MRLRTIAIQLLVIGLLVVSFITWRVGFSSVLELFSKAHLLSLAIFFLVSVLISLALSFKWRLVLRAQGVEVPFLRLASYRFIGYSVSYLTPTMHVGSEPVRAYLLKRDGVPTTRAFSNVIIDKSIELISDVSLFVFGALLILNSLTVDGRIVVLAISLFLIFLMGGFVIGILNKKSMFVWIFRTLRLHKIRKLQGIEKNLREIELEIEAFYRTQKRAFFLIVLIMIGIWGLMYLEYRYALAVLGIQASVSDIFLILTGVGIAYSIPVPAALGTLELGQLAAAKVLGLTAVTAISLAFLIRFRDLVWTALGLLLLAIHDFSFRRLARQAHEVERDFRKGDMFRGR